MHKNKNSIKGDFGLLKVLEESIRLEINDLKLDKLISLAEQVFAHNVCSNEVQILIERAITNKFKSSIDINIMKFIQLIKSLSNYLIKTDDFYSTIKNFLMSILLYKNSDSQLDLDESEIVNNNTQKNNKIKNKESKKLTENDSSSDLEEEFLGKIRSFESKLNENNDGSENEQANTKGLKEKVSENINLKFNDYYAKLTDNVNIILWMMAKNNGFKELIRKDSEYNHLFKNLKNLFVTNIQSYKPRDLLISLDSILTFANSLSKSDLKIITSHIPKVKPTTSHDKLKLLNVTI